ncbi:MAG TPA: tRNA (N(6)-L-threonylcarbamoyladenosine(37)-C(2))-methylthiotransferase MtaB [Bacillota bacterium]|nr:tRNA (N(6)-L-threonylcarbamoyladenosine(37)-C(2))-methylthiotransferase MtaB [Peptococcaceae bacterium MAG4]NLW37362.1 tRNA (N(6)-L-threonylcarbamoyladenosine(37)-C(2))-methylthiotransferase MtaB [Peptococcaceae bacterium]HPZ43869.1 tRNA (N(6)-L-threonylcarbamoyladenosine(37)-C(2))-methylthiotransferase MtaB [Bacillota bacterium]HQD76370.1 tRNA (N(6)-L-threonylcarbamoyladenosine(37)-C(2))-methylthiotransferase MtaB [Bacillota bacterium]HUM59040.1 tRNA (N(6)-L-threonylcarbamoyladenosine(37)-C
MGEKTVAITTLGCKVNQYESAALAQSFKEKGYRIVDFNDIADIYIVNTCTVTHLSDRKSRQLIRRAARANPSALIVVTGCYAQISPDEVGRIPGVNLVVGTRGRSNLVELVEAAAKEREPLSLVSGFQAGEQFEEITALPLEGRTRAFLKIQEGCTNFCTYCIVPHTRGPMRSRRPENVLKAARDIVAAGYKEIVLTGIRTGAYGQDLERDLSLASLLHDLSGIPGLLRIRLSSIEPNDITPELVEVLAGLKNFCRHLHVPLQSGDDEILQRMGRRYTTYEYARLVEVLRENLPGLGLTTDVIVGFPGESERNFENTVRYIEGISFSGLHVFKFSPRRGTPAADFADQIEPGIKEQRSRRLIESGKKLAARFAWSLVGQELDVLVEQRAGEGDSLYEGLTGNYVRAIFPGREELRGEVVRVKMVETEGTTLKGFLC